MVFLLSACASLFVPKEAKLVELYVPSCAWQDTARRVSLALEHDGVYTARTNIYTHKVQVYYDDAKITPDEMVKMLKKAEYDVIGSPKIIERE